MYIYIYLELASVISSAFYFILYLKNCIIIQSECNYGHDILLINIYDFIKILFP